MDAVKEEDDTLQKIQCVQNESEAEEVSTNKFWTTIAEILDFSAFKNPIMVLIVSVQFLFFFLQQVPYMYLPVYLSQEIGLSTDQAMLMVPVLGISNLFGILITGIVASALNSAFPLPRYGRKLIFIVSSLAS